MSQRNKRARDGKKSSWAEKPTREDQRKGKVKPGTRPGKFENQEPLTGGFKTGRKGKAITTDNRTLRADGSLGRRLSPKQEERHNEPTNTIIYGRNAVLAALDKGRSIDKILIKDGETEGSIRSIFAKAKEQGIKTERVTKKVLDGLSNDTPHQGIIAFVPAVEYSSMGDIFNRATARNQPPFIVILTNIKDPHNFGAIVRSAEAAGAHGIIIPNRRNVGITATVEKTSAGAINHIPIVRVTNIAAIVDQLKGNGIWIVGTDMTGTTYTDMNLKGPIAMIIGGEGEGIGSLLLKKCDLVASIPMHGQTTSLNASVASALVMYEIVKQRGKMK